MGPASVFKTLTDHKMRTLVIVMTLMIAASCSPISWEAEEHGAPGLQFAHDRNGIVQESELADNAATTMMESPSTRAHKIVSQQHAKNVKMVVGTKTLLIPAKAMQSTAVKQRFAEWAAADAKVRMLKQQILSSNKKQKLWSNKEAQTPGEEEGTGKKLKSKPLELPEEADGDYTKAPQEQTSQQRHEAQLTKQLNNELFGTVVSRKSQVQPNAMRLRQMLADGILTQGEYEHAK